MHLCPIINLKNKNMIRIITTFLIFLTSLTVLAQKNNSITIKTQGIDIVVSVNNVVSNKGFVQFELFREEKFLEKPVQSVQGIIKGEKSRVTFKNIQKGTYAIVCYHDVNENGIIDFAENRMPLEDIGVSNSYVRFGPPSFKESKFEVEDKKLEIEIKF